MEIYQEPTHEFEPIPAVSVLFVKIEGETSYVLLSKRLVPIEMNRLSAVGGKIELEENAFLAAIRETKEETGMVISEDDLIPAVRNSQKFTVSRKLYDHPCDFIVFWQDRMGKPQDLEIDKQDHWQWLKFTSIENFQNENEDLSESALILLENLPRIIFARQRLEIECEDLMRTLVIQNREIPRLIDVV